MLFEDFEYFDENDDGDTDVPVEAITDNDKLIAYGLFVKMQKLKMHYYSIKLRYKILASTWILASFIGLGYLISGKEIGLPTDLFTGIISVGILAAIGISLLYFFDIFIYHRLLHVIFVVSMDFEKKYKFLPQLSHDAVSLFYKRAVRPISLDSLYYSFFILLFLLISNFALYLNLKENFPSHALLISLVFFGIIMLYTFALNYLCFDRSHRKEVQNRVADLE
jgi:hypothetical protein